MRLLMLFCLFPSLLMAQELAQGRFQIDPTGTTPLSGVFRLPNSNTLPITVRVKGKNDALDIAHTYPAGYGTEFPIHGMYANYSNIIQIQQGEVTRSFRVVTQPLHERLDIKTKVFIDQLAPPDPFNQDLFFLNILSQRALIAYDRAGEIRYMQRKEIYNFIRVLHRDGEMVVQNTERGGDFTETDLLGRELIRITGEKLHHDVSYTASSNMILPALSQWGWEDAMAEYTFDGQFVTKKLIGDALKKAASAEDRPLLKKMIFDEDNIARRNGTNIRLDWAHVNGSVYNPADDTIIISLRHQGLFAFRWSTWKLLWWFADDNLEVDRGFGYGRMPRGTLTILSIPSLQKYRLKTRPGEGPRNQHAPILKANGHIVVFDNIGEKRKDPQGSRIAEYRLTRSGAQLVREFRHPQKFHSRLSSDVDLTGSNSENWLILWSETYPNRLTEVAPDNTIVFDMSFETKQLFYRADKMPLYPYDNPNLKYSIDQNEALGL
ncbi:MAG: aryl-sulfate sulfotransferase [Brevinema sp.]